jgi:hypothetical protein
MHMIRTFFIMAVVLTGLFGSATPARSETQGSAKADPLQADAADEYAGSSLLNIPLVWKPSNTTSSFDAIDLTVFQHASFTVKPFNDLRKKPAEIGMNNEKRSSNKVLYVTTRDNVAEWLTDRIGRILSDFGVPVVKDGGKMSLEADIIKYYVTEEANYKANIGLKVRLRAKNNALLWEGMVSVSSNNWGRSYQAENYYEALSNACIEVTHALLKNDSFQQAVKKGSEKI